METEQKGKSKTWLYVLGAVIIAIIAGVVYYLNNSQRTAQGFDGKEASQQKETSPVTLSHTPPPFSPLTLGLGNRPYGMNGVADINNFPQIGNAKDLKDEFANGLLKAKEGNYGYLYIPSVYTTFSFNKAELSSDAEDLIKEYSDIYLQTNKESVIVVSGYACNRGTDKACDKKSKERVDVIRQKFIELGIPADKIETAWYGKSKNNTFTYENDADYRRVIVSIK